MCLRLFPSSPVKINVRAAPDERPLPHCARVMFNETNNKPAAMCSCLLTLQLSSDDCCQAGGKSAQRDGGGGRKTEGVRCLRLPREQRSARSQINGYCGPGRKAARCDTHWTKLHSLSPTCGTVSCKGRLHGVFLLQMGAILDRTIWPRSQPELTSRWRMKGRKEDRMDSAGRERSAK